MSINIAIDGPAGAGKSTIARALAARLGYVYVDTGAMYRAMALYMLQKKISPEDIRAIEENCVKPEIGLVYSQGEQIILLDGENVNEKIRTEEVSKMASVTSAVPQVRAALLRLQKTLAAEHDVVMDGRDIGTVILPMAQVKIFLTASPQTRAMRRCNELKEKGVSCNYEEILQEIMERDQRDMTRSTSPLKQAEDAVLVDTSDLAVDQVLEVLEKLVKEKLAEE